MNVKRLAAAVLIGVVPIVTAVGAQPAAAAAGALDPAFGTGGQVLTNLGLTADGLQIQGIASDAVLQPNGDIVVSGPFGLARYLPNGRLDTGFGSGGVVQTGFAGTGDGGAGIALQANGDILWAGEGATSTGAAAFAVARYTGSGTLDPTFGTGGMVTTEFPDTPDVQGADTVLVQANGDVLVGGQVLDGNYKGGADLGALVRYTPNGALDPTFGTDGQFLSTSVGGPITALGEDASGDIFVLPDSLEFTPAGQFDAAVTPEPITVSSQGGYETFLPDGQSILANTVGVSRGNTDVQAVMHNAGGGVDTAFANAPFTFTGKQYDGHDSASAAAVQANGQIVVVGSHFESTSVFGVARLDANGKPDSTFGTAGTLTTDFQGSDEASAVLVQPNGDIVVIGSSQNNTTGVSDLALVRYLAS